MKINFSSEMELMMLMSILIPLRTEITMLDLQAALAIPDLLPMAVNLKLMTMLVIPDSVPLMDIKSHTMVTQRQPMEHLNPHTNLPQSLP